MIYLKKCLLLLVLVFIVGCSSATGKQTQEEKGLINYSKNFPEFAIKDDNVQNAQPAIFYAYANQLFGQDKKDEAVFWFYLGQFRVRYIERVQKRNIPIDTMTFIRFFRESGFVGNVNVVEPNGQIVSSPSSNPEYAKINSYYSGATYDNIYRAGSGLGEIINPYAFQNVDKHIARVDAIIAYEKEHPINVENIVAKDNLLPEVDRKRIKEEEYKAFEKFKQYLIDNKEDIRKKRAENGLLNE